MTPRPAVESPRNPDTDAIVRAVGAARRRLRTVSALQIGAIAAPGGAAMGAGLALAGWAPVGTPAVLGLLGAAGAAAWAAAHTPPDTTVARILDAHLDLRDRVSAALQLQHTGGPIAALVARDAAARLAPIDLAALFPFAIGRAPAVATAVAVAMVAWLSASGVATGPPVEAPGAVDGNVRDSGGAAGARAGSGTRDTASGPAGQDQRRQLEARPPGDRATDGADTPRAAADAPSSQPTVTARPSGAGGRERGAPSAPATRQTAATATAAAGTGAAGRAGAAAGRPTSGPMSSGAGGASGQALVPASGGGTATLPLASTRGVARAQAEAALARDVVPPDHRDHVRAYFRAVGADPAPGGSR